MGVVVWAFQLILIPLIAPLAVGLIRKVKAILQGRRGASLVQPYRELWKLFHKDEVVSKDASWVFRFAPYVIFATTLVVGASIPIFTTICKTSLTSDLIVLIYILAIGTFFLALAGLDTGGGFGGFGASREMTVAALAEGGLILSLLVLAVIHGTTNAFDLAAVQNAFGQPAIFAVILAFIGFSIAFLAENARYPFDNPSTHLELTMIHEAMILEYSGKKLALIEWAAANKLVIFMVLGANLYFPFGLIQNFTWTAALIGLVLLLAKLAVFCIGIGVLESTIAKYRFFRLPDILLASLLFSLFALGLLK